ncbi:MAG: cobyric acid synthase [Verrucomicrobia bacterium]|nr:cobyric acid synthase [Verrucomicrobiota bacterium]
MSKSQVMGHGGNLRRLAIASGKAEREVLDFSANLNPLGPPEWLRPMISSRVSDLRHYPDPDCSALVEAAAVRYGIRPDEVIAGNGSSEILGLIPTASEKRRAIIPAPAYSDYERSAKLAGLEVATLVCAERDCFRLDVGALESSVCDDVLVFIGRPNNPTGGVCGAEDLRALAARHPAAVFVVDEAFADFVEDMDRLTGNRPANVIVLLSLTKIFAMAGLRLGLAVGDAGVIRRMRGMQPLWSVNTLAQAVGAAALADREFIRRTQVYVKAQRKTLARELKSMDGLAVYPGEANFLLVKMDRKDMDAPTLARRLLAGGIAIRVCDNFAGLDRRFFRVAVRTEDENARMIEALQRILGNRFRSEMNLRFKISKSKSPKQRSPAIMFQGTSSNAGKSILAAAFCRVLLQDGFRVAPFKSQNMSLNSYVTRDGGEMGRAQVVQAQACRIEPDARMNPILLKPNSDTGAQVIVRGKPVGCMNVGEYIRYKPEAFKAAKESFASLAEECDVMVLEGAGSPAEVNLKHHDIVNMNMARYAGAPVLIVGDIDRGGVFASFVGTMEVLAEWERAQVAGFIVNRFRGKEALLKDALEYTVRHTGRPVFGVVPHIEKLGLPEEDSVSFKSGRREETISQGAGNGSEPCDGVKIAIIDLPHISNFTDFDALRIEPDVKLQVVRSCRDLDHPDAVILPGSKNVIRDLAHLRENGLDREIVALASEGKAEIIGLCGGYQMLGEQIEDPDHVESANGAVRGMGLLALSTSMAREKTLMRVEATHCAAQLRVHGYEIHHGRSVPRWGGAGERPRSARNSGRGASPISGGQASAGRLQPLVVRDDGEVIGTGTPDNPATGGIWGTYLHGIFDADRFRRWFIDRLRTRRGLAAVGKVRVAYDLEPAFERLADVVRRSVKVNEIYRLMGLRSVPRRQR